MSCIPRLKSPICPGLWSEFSFSCDGSGQGLQAQPTQGTGYLKAPETGLFTPSSVSFKQFHNRNARSWAWLSEAVYSACHMELFVSFRSSSSSTTPVITVFGTLLLLLLFLLLLLLLFLYLKLTLQ